jgi:hypothetical protein
MKTNYIYLLQEREFIKTNESIYKVGMTEKENHKRFNQYPKGSVLLFQMICNKCKIIENIIIQIFRDKFINRKDIGNEYFEGNHKHMMSIIYETISNELENNLENVDIEEDISSKCRENVSSKCRENVSSKCRENVSSKCGENVSSKCGEIVSSKCGEDVNYTNISKKHFYGECKLCNYVASRKYNLEIHNNGIKHKNLVLKINEDEKLAKLSKTSKKYECESCEKQYTNKSGLWKHKKKCIDKIGLADLKNDLY